MLKHNFIIRCDNFSPGSAFLSSLRNFFWSFKESFVKWSFLKRWRFKVDNGSWKTRIENIWTFVDLQNVGTKIYEAWFIFHRLRRKKRKKILVISDLMPDLMFDWWLAIPKTILEKHRWILFWSQNFNHGITVKTFGLLTNLVFLRFLRFKIIFERLAFSFVSSITCDIIIDKIEVDSNLNYINVTVKPVPNDDPHVYVFDVYNEMRADLLNVKVYFQLNYAESANDIRYKKELLRTVVDVEKFFARGTSNPMMKFFVDVILKSMSFKPVFPIKKVIKIICFCKNLSAIIQFGNLFLISGKCEFPHHYDSRSYFHVPRERRTKYSLCRQSGGSFKNVLSVDDQIFWRDCVNLGK